MRARRCRTFIRENQILVKYLIRFLGGSIVRLCHLLIQYVLAIFAEAGIKFSRVLSESPASWSVT